MDLIASGFFSLGERDRYRPILDGLRHSDPYFVCADFDGYAAAEAAAAEVYRDPRVWARRALTNIAGASRFSSDATIRQYATEIWDLQPVKTDFTLLG
jgi:starch phosphorylase